jgi:hypothetical protein
MGGIQKTVPEKKKDSNTDQMIEGEREHILEGEVEEEVELEEKDMLAEFGRSG